MSAALLDFVKDASRLGKSREEINAALKTAGWPEDQLAAFWSKYSDTAFPIPVPKPTVYASPRLTMLNLFFFIVLYITTYSAISILFTILDYHLPDGRGQMRGMYYSAQPIADAIRGYLAAIFVSAPLVYFTSRQLHKSMAAIGQFIHGTRLKLMNLSLLIAALVVLCNFISFTYYILSGELSIRFLLKVLILTAASAGVYYFFKPEIAAFEKKA
jgi:hypothetical protein